MRRIVSPLDDSFSSRFSFFRSLIVPKFLCDLTLFARFLIVGAPLSVSRIIRTHSSIKASLDSGKLKDKEHARYARVPVVVQPDGQNISVLLILKQL